MAASWPFGDLSPEERLQSALRQTTDCMKLVGQFMLASRPATPDPAMQRDATRAAVQAILRLLHTMLAPDLLEALIVHALGPATDSEDDDVITRRAVREMHLLTDAFLVPLLGADSIHTGALKADLLRWEDGHSARTYKPQGYQDPRRRDPTEVLDLQYAVLRAYVVAGKRGLHIADLVKSLGIDPKRFGKWAAQVPLDERKMMKRAGALEAAGAGLPVEEMIRLNERQRAVLVPEQFAALRGLSDEMALSKLFDRARRSGHFARPSSRDSRKKPPK